LLWCDTLKASTQPISKINGETAKFPNQRRNGRVVLAMAMIAVEVGTIQVDATTAEGLTVEPSLIQKRLREERITSLCKRGIDEDSGLYRLTFFSDNRRFRLVVDEKSNVVQRSAD
jgi:Family of unknown function (DUF6522)